MDFEYGVQAHSSTFHVSLLITYLYFLEGNIKNFQIQSSTLRKISLFYKNNFIFKFNVDYSLESSWLTRFYTYPNSTKHVGQVGNKLFGWDLVESSDTTYFFPGWLRLIKFKFWSNFETTVHGSLYHKETLHLDINDYISNPVSRSKIKLTLWLITEYLFITALKYG